VEVEDTRLAVICSILFKGCHRYSMWFGKGMRLSIVATSWSDYFRSSLGGYTVGCEHAQSEE